MVSRYPDSPEPTPPHQPAQPKEQVATKLHLVMVPVFLTVLVPAEDGLQAECLAVDAVRKLPDIQRSGVTIAFSSILGPMAQE